MRDRNHHTTHHRGLPAVIRPRRGVARRIRCSCRAVLGWLRAGYPDDAPATGYSPLLALCGPVGLTEGQLESVAGEAPGPHADSTELAVAITKATDRLPTDSQIRAARRRVRSPRSP